MPRAYDVIGQKRLCKSRGCDGVRRIVVIGVHGWFAQSIFKVVIGEPTGTSARFAKMMSDSILRHFREAGAELNSEAITLITPQFDGKVIDRTQQYVVAGDQL